MTDPSRDLPEPGAQPANSQSAKPRILVVDDSRIVHAAIKKAVKAEFDLVAA